MRKIAALLFTIFLFIACENKESRVFKFTQHVNDKENSLKDDFLIQSKAFYVNKKVVNLDLILKTKTNDTIPSQEFNKVENIVKTLFDKNPKGKDIIDDGTIVNLRLYNAAGIKISEIPLKEYSTKDLDILKN